ncbi:MAG: hypothetical protein QOI34_610 [Verrucomicrobiota bacterium]|jgi:hypothetical protein
MLGELGRLGKTLLLSRSSQRVRPGRPPPAAASRGSAKIRIDWQTFVNGRNYKERRLPAAELHHGGLETAAPLA